MFVPPGKLIHGGAQTTDEEEDAAEERDELDALIDADEVEERDDEDIEVELAAEEETPADDPADEVIDEAEADDNDELLPELPVPEPGLKTSLPELPHAAMTRLLTMIVAMERIFIGNSQSG